jgi:hypothetical protein
MSITFNDYSGEKSTLSFRCVALSPANVAAQETALTDLATAILAITLGVKNKQEIVYSSSTPTNTPASSPVAQRETKWLVRFTDTVNGRKGSIELPCAEADTHIVTNTDIGLLTGEMATFVSALEAVMLSVDGNAIDVLGITLVGRNN